MGIANRLPGAHGGVLSNAGALWEALLHGRDLITSVDASRWGQDALLHPRRSEPGAAYTFAAGSIGDVTGFDAAFFGISPREAAQMDPQQRLLLELTWEALENANIPPSSIRGRRWAVYLGLSTLDYSYRRAEDLAAIDAATMTGNTASIAANRISYVFDLRGPSMAVDTACSSSLVAFHQACQSIRCGESAAAVVGGVSLHLHPYGFIGFSKASMLSRSGRCSVFDAAADGYVRSEGGAMVILKPLEQALVDGNPILALVAGSGVNTDGHKQGLSVPSHAVQAELLREVYAQAGIAPGEIDYLEAHGTGTAVGDPIEAHALGEAIGQARAPGKPLAIGSIKSNLGHLEAASGMAGLAKALLVIQHRCIPPTIHLAQPNPNIRFDEWNLAPITQALPLATEKRLVVGINSFGFGGANAHVVLTSFEDGVRPTLALPSVLSSVGAPIVVSARSPEALRESAAHMAQHLVDHPDQSVYDIAYSAFFNRDAHTLRLLAGGRDRAALVDCLQRFASAGSADGVVTGSHLPNASAPAFVYSGNGSQWAGMGQRLLEEDETFKRAIHEVDALFVAEGGGGWSVLAELGGPLKQSRLDLTEVAQPALFAVQVGLTRMLQQRGVSPGAACGHSVGEVAAAWASGALTLPQAVHVVHHRSLLQATTKGAGQMTAVALGAIDLEAMLDSLRLTGRVTIGGLNSVHGVTVAGDAEALARLEATLAQGKVRFKRLKLDYAFHAPAMDPIRERLELSLAGLQPHASRIPFFSTVSGGLLAGERLDAGYWWHNVRDPVRFQDAIQSMLLSGINVFVEVGPDAVLRTYLNECVRDPRLKGRGVASEARVLHTMQRNEARAAPLDRIFEQLLLAGAPVDKSAIFPVPARPVQLPSYPWQRERHWYSATSESLGLLDRRMVHPLLGYRVTGIDLAWENHLDTTRLPTYADHAVGGAVVLPGAGFAELALAAAAQWKPDQVTAIEDLEIRVPLLLSAERSRTVRVQIDASDGRFTIRARDRLSTDPWAVHATGRIVEAPLPLQARPLALPAAPHDADGDRHYQLTESLGLQYGPAFRVVSAVWFEGDALVAALDAPYAIQPEIDQSILHPSFLDGAFQLLADLAGHRATPSHNGAPGEPSSSTAYLPVRIERLQVLVPRSRVRSARAVLLKHTARSLVADFALYDESGQAVAIVRRARFRAAHLARNTPERARLVGMRAVPMPRREAARGADLPPVRDFAARCARRLHEPQRVAARRRFSDEVDPLLDVLCTAFAEQALRQAAGTDPALDPSRLIAIGAVAPSAESLLLRLLQMLAEHDLVEPAGERWLWRTGTQLPPPQDIWASLVADYPEYASLAGQVGSAGIRLAARLHAGSLSEQVGSNAPECNSAWRQCCTQSQAHDLLAVIGDLVQQAVALQPAGSRLRVLYLVSSVELLDLGWLRGLDRDRCELVVGTGCADVIDALNTSLADDRVPLARAIDLDGAAEREPRAAFDVVVIADGVALAPDPMARVSRARHLLADHGLLVLLEQHPSSAADFIFGTDPRWWQASAAGQPVCSRLRSPKAWREALERCGFCDAETVTDLPGPDLAQPAAEAAGGPYLVLARAAAADRPVAAPAPTAVQTWIVLQDKDGYAAELGDELENELSTRGHRVVTVVAGPAFKRKSDTQFGVNPYSEASWARLLQALRVAGHPPNGWVHLHGLAPGDLLPSSSVRLAGQRVRARALTAWLKACVSASIAPDAWVVGSEAGLALMPAGAMGVAPPEADRMRDAALWGVARVAMHEFAPMRIRWVDLIEPRPCVLNAAKLVREMLDPDAEDEILLTLNARYVPRLSVLPELAPLRVTKSPPAVRLEISNPGSLNNLVWRRHEFVAPGPGEVEIQVHAAGLNFRDVMYAIGLLPDEALENGFSGATLGMELSGVVTRVGSGVTELAPGQEVLAFAPAAFGNRVVTQAAAVVPKPAGWSFAAAATVPTAFFTAYYALNELARLREGERILIHGAAGGVGLAAIQLAKHLGAEIFATAGTPEKRDFVRLMGAHHVFDSRSLAFADQVMAATGGAGVDVILNSLAGEAVTRNLRILRPFGRLLELGKRDFYENTHIGLRPFRNNIAYFGIDADQLMAHRPDLTRRLWLELMTLFVSGTLHPLPHRSFSAVDIAEAFRYMRDSRQTGKIVVEFAPDFDPPESAPPSAPTPAFTLRADATYLVTGGLTGFGLRTAQWLIDQGARHLALLGRRGADTPEAKTWLESWQKAGVAVHAIACDVADADALAAALTTLRSSAPPLRGAIHAAMVMDDALIRNLEARQFDAVLAPKVAGALNLHRLTLDAPLDFFVLYSSATTLFGNPGQAAYVAANMALEALVAERRALGLPAACVQWGPIGDAGYLARNTGVRDALASRLGGQPLAADRALELLGQILASGAAQVGVFEFNWATLGRYLPGAAAPKFSELARLAEREGTGPQLAEDLRSWLGELADNELAPALTDILKREIGNILRVAPERIDPSVSLYEVGMDSLMAVELTMALESRLAIKVPMMAFSEGPTIERLVQRLTGELRPGSACELATASSDAIEAGAQVAASQHAHDLDAETVARIAKELADEPSQASARPISQPTASVGNHKQP